MNVAYLFTFFLFVLLVLFVLLPFLRESKSESSDVLLPEDTPLADERSEPFSRAEPVAVASSISSPEREIEIEVAVARARAQRSKSTFWNCAQCGRQMQDADQFCASCGVARQSL